MRTGSGSGTTNRTATGTEPIFEARLASNVPTKTATESRTALLPPTQEPPTQEPVFEARVLDDRVLNDRIPIANSPDGSFPDDPGPEAKRSLPRRFASWMGRLVWTMFSAMWWVVLIAVMAAVPIVQLAAFGYLLRVSGHLAQGGRLRTAIPHLHSAGRIGLAVTALFLAALPSQLFAHYEAVASIVDPGSARAILMRVIAITLAIIALNYLVWCWLRGGRVRHYLWPEPIRFLREGWRPRLWSEGIDRLWAWAISLEFPATWWLGARAAAGTLIWLIPAMIVMAAFRRGETGLAGLVGVTALFALGIGMQYLPMLQVHFASTGRFASLFAIRQVRHDFRRAPWAYLLAMFAGLLLFPIPLYLLKIEATPSEAVWLPCLVMVAFLLPARIAEGLAIRRARFIQPTRKQRRAGMTELQAREVKGGAWPRLQRWMVRAMMPGVIATYLLFVYVSQYVSWDGYETWVQQHAVLLPIPFLEGT